MAQAAHDEVCEVRDAIYGFVKLTKAEWEIINEPAFQRLRDIRQLDMAHLVYPGANHTRFEHSIGCVHLASMMFDALVERDGDVLASEFGLNETAQRRARQALRLAALLHDIGHAPFSHTGEGLLPVNDHGEKLDHEDLTARIIEHGLSDLIRARFGALGLDWPEIVAIATKFEKVPQFRTLPFHGFLNELLTGELGTDRIDYLLRDALHSGQPSGFFDFRRLVGCLTMVPSPDQGDATPRIGLDEGGWLVAEQMLAARYFMYQSLYFHKTKRILGIHLTEFVEKWLMERFGAPTLPSAIDDYLAISDSDVWFALRSAAHDENHTARESADRLIHRKHMRLAHEIILADCASIDPRGRRVPDRARFGRLVEHVRNTLGLSCRADAPDHSATKMFDEGSKLLVKIDDTPRYLNSISEVVGGMASKIWRGRVYADRPQLINAKKLCKTWLKENPTQEA
ncbi:MAG: HD domain-containing protein [Phycisphaerales bacterium]|nr:HD domain-containing protein [Phycisphaerales bacterium]